MSKNGYKMLGEVEEDTALWQDQQEKVSVTFGCISDAEGSFEKQKWRMHCIFSKASVRNAEVFARRLVCGPRGGVLLDQQIVPLQYFMPIDKICHQAPSKLHRNV